MKNINLPDKTLRYPLYYEAAYVQINLWQLIGALYPYRGKYFNCEHIFLVPFEVLRDLSITLDHITRTAKMYVYYQVESLNINM